MTRKDFELIAQVIRVTPLGRWARWEIAQSMAHALAGRNPRFDRPRFIMACTEGANVDASA